MMWNDQHQHTTTNDPNVVEVIESTNTRMIVRSLCGPFVIQSTVLNSRPEDSTATTTTTTTTTASVLSVDNNDDEKVFQMQYSLIPLDSLPQSSFTTNSLSSTTSDTHSAVQAWSTLLHDDCDKLSDPTPDDASKNNILVLQAIWTPALYHLQIDLDTSSSKTKISDDHSEMIAVLSRVLVQHTLLTWYRNGRLHERNNDQWDTLGKNLVTIQIGSEVTPLTIPFPTFMMSSLGDGQGYDDIMSDATVFVRSLFQGLSMDTSKSELVEMVYVECGTTSTATRHCDDDDDDWNRNDNHRVLGVVPRHWVHQYNLLHRGIGVFVTKDTPIVLPRIDTTSRQQPLPPPQPEVYCHQRTSTKRIFPSLFDMFIGGVSMVGESSISTALREVSEELGLSTTMIQPDRLSRRLFQCIVCTSYNRCVVDVFGYAIDTTTTDKIVWQEEEVAWGAFVPYHIVEASAFLSIDRLRKDNKWPGRYDTIQNSVSLSTESDVTENSVSLSTESDVTENTDDDTMIDGIDQWKTWEFVPDGLLVWESWLNELYRAKTVGH